MQEDGGTKPEVMYENWNSDGMGEVLWEVVNSDVLVLAQRGAARYCKFI